ncbi:MAG: SOS response-associated peptidase [Nanoarchaeota archaeon]
MCGRFSLSKAEKQLFLDRFKLKDIRINLQLRYNIAPGQNIAVILNNQPDILSEALWGLIPDWAKDSKMGYKMINARSETISEKPAYKGPFENKRCLIPADSYYEWKKAGKVPYRIMLKDESLFCFAGIFDIWQDKLTCSIVTTEPNDLVKKVHIRMPVILDKKEEKNWLDSDPKDALELLKPIDSSKLKMYQISKLVNSPTNNNVDIIKEESGLGAFIS